MRNPMDLDPVWGMLAITFASAANWMLVMLVPFAFMIHSGVVLREERYLEARFGADDCRCRGRPRYGWCHGPRRHHAREAR